MAKKAYILAYYIDKYKPYQIDVISVFNDRKTAELELSIQLKKIQEEWHKQGFTTHIINDYADCFSFKAKSAVISYNCQLYIIESIMKQTRKIK
jgi:hypothetical protein